MCISEIVGCHLTLLYLWEPATQIFDFKTRWTNFLPRLYYHRTDRYCLHEISHGPMRYSSTKRDQFRGGMFRFFAHSAGCIKQFIIFFNLLFSVMWITRPVRFKDNKVSWYQFCGKSLVFRVQQTWFFFVAEYIIGRLTHNR